MKLRVAPLLVALLLTQAGHVLAAPSPTQLSFEIFTDGVVRTSYSLTVDQTEAQVNVTLFGDNLEDLFFYDEEGLPLESEKVGDYYQVNTLGATQVDASYLTSDLTGKAGAIWSIEVETPISSMITLPLGSTIINLNEIPLEIETVDEQTRLVMPAGSTVVSYTIYIQDSESIATEALLAALAALTAAENAGVVISASEDIYQEGLEAFESEDYLTAQEKADESTQLTAEIVQLETEAQDELDYVRDAIQTAEDAGKTVGLDIAVELLEEATTLHSNGDYAESLGKSEEALEAVLLAEVPGSRNNYLLLGVGVLGVLGIAAYVMTRGKSVEKAPEDIEIDLELLFEEHPELRIDDREALRFMAEHGGEAFAHEVRERFGIPRTSAWRMVQRLQRFEVIEERKVGGQSLISIVERYRRRKT
jgi:uncharacterized membrane protein